MNTALSRFRLLACSLCCGAWSQAAAPDKTDALFDPLRIFHLSLWISPKDFDSLRVTPKKAVFATLTEQGKTYTNVAVHLKGGGSFRPVTDKPSFSIKFNERVPGTRFHGHTRILLENSSQDPSYLHRKLTSELALQAGLPAARVTYATVELNGRKLGLYTLSEAMTKDFLARHFGSPSGNLYEGSNHDIFGQLEQDSGDDPRGPQQLQALIGACRETDPARRWNRLNATLDMERFLTFVAFEVLIGHRDGYSMDLNNYRLHGDPNTGRFVFIPHGMDLVFHDARAPLEPSWKGIVPAAVLSVEEGRKRYRERMTRLGEDIYGGDKTHQPDR